MSSYHTIKDPLGNLIKVPLSLVEETGERSFFHFVEIISSPAFIISVKDDSLYFIRKINARLNVLIEAGCKEDFFIAKTFIKNPSAEYISKLLEKGFLTSYP